jgi:hypothetical protein
MSSHQRPSTSNLYSYLPGAKRSPIFQNPSSSFPIGWLLGSQLLKSPTSCTSFASGALTLKVTFLFSGSSFDTLPAMGRHIEARKIVDIGIWIKHRCSHSDNVTQPRRIFNLFEDSPLNNCFFPSALLSEQLPDECFILWHGVHPCLFSLARQFPNPVVS